MSGSTLTAFLPIPENSDGTPGLWNSRFQTLQDNIVSINSVIPDPNLLSGSTWASIGLFANSNNSDYFRLKDSSGQRSTYRIGSAAGGTADGLNIYDESGSTMIASFSKQSIRFYQNVVGPVFDVGGALADTLNAATFGTGADSIETRIQAAINAASNQGITRVYVPANMYPYSCSSVSFIGPVKMIREGGDQVAFDIKAYGARGNQTQDDSNAIISAISGAVAASGGVVFLPPGFYKTTQTVYVPRWVNLEGVGFHAPGNTYDGLSVILARHSGAAILSLKGAHACRLDNLLLQNSSTTLIPKTGLCIGRDSGLASAGLHVIQNVNVGGYFSQAAVYQVASEENEFRNLHIYLQGGGALHGLWLSQGDSLGVDSLGASSHIDNIYYNIRVSSEVSSDAAACISISGGASSGDANFFGGYLLPAAGSYVSINVNQDGSSMSRSLGFYGLSGEINPAAAGPLYGYHFDASGALSASVEILGSYMPLRVGGSFLKLETNTRLLNSRIVVPTPDRGSAYVASQMSRSEIDLGAGRFVWGDSGMQDTGKFSVSGDNTSGLYWGSFDDVSSPRIRHQSAASQLQILDHAGAAFYGLATGALTTYSTLDANDIVTFDRAAGAGGGTFIQLKSGAARFGILGCSGAIQGDATTDLGVFADAGKLIKFYPNGTLAGTFQSTGTLNLVGPLWGSGISIGGTGTLIPAISSVSSKIGAFVVQPSSSSFTVVTWAAVKAGDQIMVTPFGAGVSSVSSGLVVHSHCTQNGQIEVRLSNVSTLAQNQSSISWFFTRITPF